MPPHHPAAPCAGGVFTLVLLLLMWLWGPAAARADPAGAVEVEAEIVGAAVGEAGDAVEVVGPPVKVGGPAVGQGKKAAAVKAGGKARAEEDADAHQPPDEAEAEQDFFRGAHLETDFEADRYLRRARGFLEADPPRYRHAVLVLQHVIETSANVLTTLDGRIYRPVREMAEQEIVAMGPAGLEAYRTEVDGQVKALLDSPAENRDVEALRTVESRYFLSTWGDEAAFTLGCLYLDRHQYARARRLFGRLLRTYPDLTVPREQILLRLAVACRRSGDPAGARAAWQDLERLETTHLSPEVLAAVRREMQAPAQETAAPPSRSSHVVGPMPELAEDRIPTPSDLWVPLWQRLLALLPSKVPGRYFGADDDADDDAGKKASTQRAEQVLREQVQTRWEQSNWAPSGSVLVDGRDLFVKSNARLVCLDAETGKVRWETALPPKPEKKQARFSFSTHNVSVEGPRTPVEMLVFGDRIGKAVSAIGNRVYHIEDHLYDQWTSRHRHVVIRIVNGKRVRTESEQQPKGSRLAAYDRETGKAVWRLGRTLDESAPFYGVRFLAPPVACGGRVLVPFVKEGEVSLAALGPADGRVLWRTFLCSRPMSRQATWDEVGLCVAGTEVYVASGEGVVFALDGVDGTIHWAARYERTPLENVPRKVAGTPTAGWRGNHVSLAAGRLVVLPADAKAVLVLDPKSGSLLLRHETGDLEHCLDVDHNRLWASGPEVVRCLDLDDGRPVWEVAFGDEEGRIRGRGFVTPQAVYVPVETALLRLDRRSGRRLARLAVLTPDGAPLGNVTGDGERMFVLGPGRVYSLASAKHRLADLDRAVAEFGEALSVKADRLRAAERDLAAARRVRAGLDQPIADAARLLDGLRTRQEEVEQQIREADDRIAALRRQREQLEAESADADGDAAAVADRRREIEARIAEESDGRADLVARQGRLPAKVADARRGLEQLQQKKADSDARIQGLEKQVADRSKDLADARDRYGNACVARARIERGYEWYDKAAASYRLAVEAAGESPLKEKARRALLDVYLAKAEASEPDAALDALNEARRVAEGTAETLLVRRAMAEGYQRADHLDRALAAYLEMATAEKNVLVDMCVDSGLRPGGAGSWKVAPAGAARHGVQTLLRKHGDRLAGPVRSHAQRAIERARADGGPVALRRVMRLFAGSEEAVQAGVEAAAAARKQGSCEIAELMLHEMMRSAHRPTRAAGLAHLARMHQDLGWTAQARAEWKRLARGFPGTSVPFEGKPVVAEALARQRLADPAVAEAAGPVRTMPSPPWQRLWKTEEISTQPMVFPAGRLGAFGRACASQFLLEHVLIWSRRGETRLVCRRLRDGSVVYDSDLGQRHLSPGRGEGREGHIVMAQGGDGVSAVGLLSGKVLWTRKVQAKSARKVTVFSALHRVVLRAHKAIQVQGGEHVPTGTLVLRPDPQSVRVLDLATGDVLWERSFRRRVLAGVQEAGSYLCLLVSGGTELWVCDPLTGACLNRLRVDGVRSVSERGVVVINGAVTMSGGFVMTGKGFFQQAVDPKAKTYGLCLRALPSGRVLWRAEPSPKPVSIRLISGGDLCLIQRGRDAFEIRDLKTGAVRFQCGPDKIKTPYIADVGLGPEGRLLYVVTRHAGNGVHVFDLETGAKVRSYVFGERARHRYLPADLYAACGAYLPWAERDPPERKGNSVRYNNLYTVRFVRRSDGEPAENVRLPSSREDGKFEHLRSVVCQNGVILVLTSRGIEVFGGAPAGRGVPL